MTGEWFFEEEGQLKSHGSPGDLVAGHHPLVEPGLLCSHCADYLLEGPEEFGFNELAEGPGAFREFLRTCSLVRDAFHDAGLACLMENAIALQEF